MPSSWDLLNLKVVSEHFNRFFGVSEKRVSNAKLSVFVEADCKHLAAFGEKYRMEFSTWNLFDWLTVEILACCVLGVNTAFVLIQRFYFSRFVVHIKDLSFDRLLVLVLTELIPGVIADSINCAIIASEKTVLKAERELCHFDFRKWSNQDWIVSMDVITCAKLARVVIAPCKHIISRVYSSHETTPHLQINNLVREVCLLWWRVLSTREHRAIFLQESDHARKSFIGLQKAIRSACAEWPPPWHYFSALIDNSHVCLVARN